MPRLNHVKTRTGCQRCKSRKCDEGRPSCSACNKHNVECKYNASQANRSQHQRRDAPVTHPNSVTSEQEPKQDNAEIDHLLEMRLMYEWTAHTCHTFPTSFWQIRAPPVALKYRHVLDGLLCLAALHAARCRATEVVEPVDTIDEMQHAANNYFQRAVTGHRKALTQLSLENVEAAYICCTCITFAALLPFGQRHGSPLMPGNDFTLWLKIARGMKHIVNQVCCGGTESLPNDNLLVKMVYTDSRFAKWCDLAGADAVMQCSAFSSEPDLSKPDQLYCRKNAEPFQELLTWASDHEVLTPDDCNVYEKALCYVGLMYKGIAEGFDRPHGTCRRVMAMASLLPARFVELIELRRPRALAILMHVFACMKLVEEQVFWFKGIAQHRIPEMLQEIPEAWRAAVRWPLSLIEETNI